MYSKLFFYFPVFNYATETEHKNRKKEKKKKTGKC